jgi:RsmE family RNA methyltransferase
MVENESGVIVSASTVAQKRRNYDATPRPQTPICAHRRVNLILFDPTELKHPLPPTDRRARHILTVLRRTIGDICDVGVINGPRGKATVTAVDARGLVLAFTWGEPPPPLNPLTLLIGLPRPQTARDILRDATSLGVSAIHFVRTEKSESSYAQSTLWSSGEWRRHLLTGAEQAFDTRIPEVSHGRTLADVLASIPSDASGIALDNYESPKSLGEVAITPGQHHVLALGAERGWSARERDELRSARFVFVHLGSRVLRTETATIAALAILRAKLGLM